VSDHNKTCSDCGRSPIPRLQVVYVGAGIMCSKCAHAPPKVTTMYHGGAGSGLWWNNSAGGKPVEYMRTDLVDALVEAVKDEWACDASNGHNGHFAAMKRVSAAIDAIKKARGTLGAPLSPKGPQ
jgi:hypothetical protein